MLLGVLACGALNSLVGETLFDKYSTVPASERWAIPGPDEEVAGDQNTWFVTRSRAAA